MRLTPKFLIRIFVIVILLVFLGPLLISKLDSKDKEAARSRKQKRHQSIHEKDVGENNIQKPVAGIGDVLEEGIKQYGPKQELKPGVLGNFEPKDPPNRNRPGDGGLGVVVNMAEKTAADASIREFGFNMVASDKVPMDRTVKDTRLDECKYWHYPTILPTASVILVFHNEGFTTLVRTVHSIVNTSPPEYLKEIVMVDDFSSKDHLKQKLEDYLKDNFKPGLVKLYRNKERLGLIQTRTAGAKYSTGDVIIFLDAHCECNKNWLVPLLARIAYDRTIMAVPTIDGIDWNTMRYSPVYNNQHHRGIFEWGFLYKESVVPDKELNRREHHSFPYRSPTHAGGLFAMDRNYFFELGAYDEGMQIWGGENFELSFKIWQCGGSIEWVPCSRVGHIYRNHMPYGFGNVNPKIPIILLNYMRVVEVWLDDEFKEYFYTREPTIRGYPIGDISKQLKFKQDHKCKSFKWFMENVAYEIYDRFPPPPPNKAWGEFKQRDGNLCLDSMGGQVGSRMGLSGCHHYGGNQLFRLNVDGQLATGERCIDVIGSEISVHFCPVEPNGFWKYDKRTGQIEHVRAKKCLEAQGSRLVLGGCNLDLRSQQWDVNQVRTW